MLFVQFAGLLGLIWYAIETYRLRKVAMDQVEGLSKPCLTLCSEPRDARQVILERFEGVIGSTVVRDNGGAFIVQNIGNGVALNISYQFILVSPPAGHLDFEPRYIQNILAAQPLTIAEPVSAYPGHYKLIFHYESIGGRKYETVVAMNRHVLTGFKFTPFGGRRALDRFKGEVTVSSLRS